MNNPERSDKYLKPFELKYEIKSVLSEYSNEVIVLGDINDRNATSMVVLCGNFLYIAPDNNKTYLDVELNNYYDSSVGDIDFITIDDESYCLSNNSLSNMNDENISLDEHDIDSLIGLIKQSKWSKEKTNQVLSLQKDIKYF